MGMKLNTTAIALVLLLASAAEVSEGASFDVTKHGAKADGSDISQALLAAWKEACASPTPSSVLVPAGTYGLGQICFEGPCKAPINLIVEGTLKAPVDTKNFKADAGWVAFQNIDHFTLSGKGVLMAKDQLCGAKNVPDLRIAGPFPL
ncbi:Polygalacturonase [Vitis vinifera]|uniref:Polygalacturonase n=1 Tax=Vitis vinifera TaxID=29760 RepID=A0A438DQ76_VITVI|nr:Polygalacturonase [Vitis vinifera]